MQDRLFYPYLNKTYPEIVKAEGMVLKDSEGKEYLDACSGAVSSNIGHGVPEVIEAIKKELDQVTFTHRFKFTNAPARQLAGLLADLAPGEDNRVTFVSGGAEAVEYAIKLAREYFIELGRPSKYKVVSRWQSFHGNSLGALSAGGSVSRRKRYSPMLLDFPHAAPHNCYHCPFGQERSSCRLECARDLEQVIRREGAENIAAVICEPVVGSSLCVSVPPPSYWPLLRDICDRYDVLLIADEVMSGVGRTGRFFALEHWDVAPDIIALAKGLGGCYIPLGAAVLRGKIYRAFKNNSGSFAHGHTFGGNPVAAAAGLEVVTYILKNKLLENTRNLENHLLGQLRSLQDKYPAIGRIEGIGLFAGIEFVRDRSTRRPFDPSDNITDAVVDTALEMGLVLYGSRGCADGISGDGVIIAPPLNVSENDIDAIVQRFDHVLARVFL